MLLKLGSRTVIDTARVARVDLDVDQGDATGNELITTLPSEFPGIRITLANPTDSILVEADSPLGRAVRWWFVEATTNEIRATEPGSYLVDRVDQPGPLATVDLESAHARCVEWRAKLEARDKAAALERKLIAAARKCGLEVAIARVTQPPEIQREPGRSYSELRDAGKVPPGPAA